MFLQFQWGLWAKDLNRSRESQFTQNVYVRYIKIGHSIEYFSLLADLRAEQTFVNFELKKMGEQFPNDLVGIFLVMWEDGEMWKDGLRFDDNL